MKTKKKLLLYVVVPVFVMGGLATTGASALLGLGGASTQQTTRVVNQGVGIYSDASTAMQMSTFTINPRMVSCGVGTIGGLGLSGPFAMLMYSSKVDSYKVDTGSSTITATGTMRSITHMSGTVIEDAMHDFVAIATDKDGGADRYDLYFQTPFWNAGNPFCSKADVIPGGCRFGGDLLLGEVTA